jgi:hypothetical protein
VPALVEPAPPARGIAPVMLVTPLGRVVPLGKEMVPPGMGIAPIGVPPPAAGWEPISPPDEGTGKPLLVKH